MSFTADTKVLLASGLAIPIASLKPGEKVLAANVRTGKTQAEPVAAVLVHHDTNRYDLTVKTSHASAIIHTTSNHLFWDLTQHKWVKAGALRYGDHLRTPNGVSVTAAGGHTPANAAGWMWDLTIANDHDFYVAVTSVSLLVHNCPTFDGFDATVHGAQQLASRGFDATTIRMTLAGQSYEQADGATAYVMQTGENSYNVIVRGSQGIVTGMRGITQQEVSNLARNYQWSGYP